MNEQRYKLVHGAPVEDYSGQPEYTDATQFAIWERLNHWDLGEREYTLIFGHTPTEYYQSCYPMEVWRHSCGVGIDCGSGYPEPEFYGSSGRLACLRLDDGNVFYSAEGI